MEQKRLLGFSLFATFITEWVFPFVYALTVTPFTVQFFRRFAHPPSTDIKLFNYFPLSNVHEFFLPIFILTIEIISIQVATGLWINLMNKKIISSITLMFVFLLLQFFPTFSTYFDTRLTELDQIQNKDIQIEQDDRNREKNSIISQKYQIELRQFEKEQEQLNSKIKVIEDQIQQDRIEIKQLTDQTERLNRDLGRPGTLAQREKLQLQIAQTQQLIDDRNNIIKSNQAQLTQFLKTQLISPTQPKTDESIVSLPMNRSTDVDFIVKTLGTPNSNLAFIVALIFPFAVIGAGYLKATTNKNISNSQILNTPILDLEYQLKECSSLPTEAQQSYSQGLYAVITAYIASIKSSKNLAIANSSFHLNNELELSLVKEAAAIRDQVIHSKVSADVKTNLIQHVDKLLTPFSTQQN